MRRPSRSGLLLAYALCAGAPVAAQNLESIGREKAFSFSGGLSFNQIFYYASGAHARRDPYSGVASGNVNLSVYGWAIPVSFTVSNHQRSFTQPFNRYSMHPSWKSITVHAGYTSMSLSPYTVNGHIFLGSAIDIAPKGKWKLSALYGRFLKAVETDTAHSGRPASFRRTGYGIKATYGDGSNFVNAIVFHAADHAGSIRPLSDTLGITPQENLVVSVGVGKALWRRFRYKGEIASSALSRDTRSAAVHDGPWFPGAGILFQPRLASSYYKAFKSSFDYQREGWLAGLAWERIDPEYETLGAYYFNNDLENVTANASGSFLSGAINLAASAGVQHDNLDKTKVSTMRRLVGSLNASYTLNQQLSLSGSYSTFQTYTNMRSAFETINQLTPYDNLDTLNFTQISRNASLSGMYSFGKIKAKKQTITANLGWQEAADRQGNASQTSGTRFYNANAAYALNVAEKKVAFVAAFNGTVNEGASFHSSTWGPNIALTKSLFHGKFRTTFASSYNRSFSDGTTGAAALTFRLNGSAAFLGRHRLTVTAVMVTRTTGAERSGKSLREFTGTAGYSYSFGTSH